MFWKITFDAALENGKMLSHIYKFRSKLESGYKN